MHPSLIDLLKHALLDLKASWVMWILLGLSVIDLIIIVERAAFLRSIRDDIPKLAAQLDALLRGGRVREALEKMKASRSVGTVIGVIEAFDILGRPADAASAAVQAASALAPQAIMSSIAEALVATAVGLFVAIPAVAAFNWFQRRIQAVGANTEALSNVVLAHLAAEAPPAEAQAAAP